MLALGTERIGELAVVECKGRIVRSEEALKLRDTIMPLRDYRIIVLDLSDVSAIEGGGLSMLQFLHRWAYDHSIQLKLFSPARSVRERLQRATSTAEFDIATLHEMMAILANADSRFALAA
jgi:anti-anti-sigma regulatory factor